LTAKYKVTSQTPTSIIASAVWSVGRYTMAYVAYLQLEIKQ